MFMKLKNFLGGKYFEEVKETVESFNEEHE
jgi:hypothetical protein